MVKPVYDNDKIGVTMVNWGYYRAKKYTINAIFYHQSNPGYPGSLATMVNFF